MTAASTKVLRNWLHHEKGATAVEYVVILALFAVVVVGAISLVTAQVNDSFDGVVNELASTP